MTFPPDFKWGAATSSHQVEGHNRNNDWWVWEQQPGAILNGDRSGAACEWWTRIEPDLDAAAEIGINAHRISLEWSRIEPEPGRFDAGAIERYRDILCAMIARSIEPMVTLWHFSNPLWLVEQGDFNNEAVVERFRRYAAEVVARLGDLVPIWITLNEPVVYIFMRYLDGSFPPAGQPGLSAARTAALNLLRCHAAAYHEIKSRYPEALVSVAKSMQIFEAPPDGSALDRWWAKRIGKIYNHAWLQAMATGRAPWLAGRGRITHLSNSFDFIGINYYTRYLVRFPPPKGVIEQDWGSGVTVSDGGYGEVYPYGLYRVIRQALPYNKPIYITENGLPDRTDAMRPAFILDHLRQVWHALSFAYPVMGYYHWSLVDNFEWDRGWTQRFGLMALDTATQERTWRPSAHLYRDICHSYCINNEMAARYAPEMLEVIFPGEGPGRAAAAQTLPAHGIYQDHLPEAGDPLQL